MFYVLCDNVFFFFIDVRLSHHNKGYSLTYLLTCTDSIPEVYSAYLFRNIKAYLIHYHFILSF